MTKLPINEKYSAWNPGIETEIPTAYRELETIYDAANVFTSLDDIQQLVAESGLSALELINFRPKRLVLHELIVRITADIVVQEGEAEEDLGINFRAIANRIFDRYLLPQLDNIEKTYELSCSRIEKITVSEINSIIVRLKPLKAPAPTWWQRLTGAKPKPPVQLLSRREREFEIINEYKKRGLKAENEFEAAVFRSLHRVLGLIATKQGFIGNDPQYLSNICILHATNYMASRLIGRDVGEIMNIAVAKEGYSWIPDAEHPVLFSLKGASASGKSWLRPMLSSKLDKLGIKKHGYGTISPDIWRKLLLDYDSLGESFKYAGRFTSHEVSVIDSRLDRYIRDKAKKSKSIPHMVVDRFRFDSFASEKIARVLHNTYVRYIDTMYMYFIITPPEATVERGWNRGLERGRYKAVEDYLGHCLEAYEGIPKVLFKWMANEKPRYSFKFYDNSVPKGSFPILIARGTQGWMQIFEPNCFVDIERYKRINIQAISAEQVVEENADLKVRNNLGFLRQCIKRIEHIELTDAASERVYLDIVSSRYTVTDHNLFKRRLEDQTFYQIINELAPDLIPLNSKTH